jgi:putative copper export protein/mono/diheme cytochrome c family protein
MDALVRALLYVGILLLLGAGLFGRWIGPEVTSRAARRRLQAGQLAGAVVLIGGSAVEVASALSRALGAFDVSLVPTYLAETRHGNAVLARTAAVLMLIWLGPAARRRRGWDRLVLLALGLVLLVTFSLTSHAGAIGGILPVVADLGHLVGATAWGGALIYLAWLPIWPSPGHPGFLLVPAVARVSMAGLVGVAVLILTGLYASILHIWGLAALTGTSYGHALMYKVGVVIVILAVAAVNRWMLVPTLTLPRSIATLGRLVKVESLLVVGVLALTGLLTSQAPPELPASLAEVTSFSETAGPWTLNGSLSPRQPDGLNFEMSIRDAQGNPPPRPLDVQIIMNMQDHPMPPVGVQASSTGPGSYRATVALPMAGRWQLVIRLPDGTARVDVQAKGGTVTGPAFAWRQILPGVLMLLLAVVLVFLALRLMSLTRWARRAFVGFGAALAILGIVLIIRGQESGTNVSIRDLPNPVTATPESRAIGEQIYQRQCVVCHGVTGAGNGPAAAALRPRPADLRVHMAAGHTDGQLFDWITNGFVGTPMPAFKDTLSEKERWDTINFIRTFALTDR